MQGLCRQWSSWSWRFERAAGSLAPSHHHVFSVYIYIYIYIYITLYNTISKCLHDRPKLFGRLCKHLLVIIGNCNTISKCLHDRLCSYVVDRASIYWCGKWCSAGDVAFFASECEACSHAALRKPLWVQGLCRHWSSWSWRFERAADSPAASPFIDFMQLIWTHMGLIYVRPIWPQLCNL